MLKILKIFLTLVLAFGLPFFIGNSKLTEISCVSQFGECNTQIVGDLNAAGSQTLFSANKKISSLLNDNVYVEKYIIQYALPTKFIVHIIQKKPFFAIRDTKSGQIFLVDKAGIVLSTSTESTIFPLLLEDFSYSTGQKVDDKLLFALNTTTLLAKTYRLQESVFKSEFSELTLENGVKVLFPVVGDINYLTGSFVLMYNQLEREDSKLAIDNSNIAIIDLRFRNPVLVKK